MLRKAAVLLMVSALAFTAPPAEAHTDACTFIGSMTISRTGDSTANWLLSTTAGTCMNQPWFSASGDMTFSLVGTMTGTGITNTGHRFGFTGTTAVFYLAGEVTGTWLGAPDPDAMGSRAIICADLVLIH